VQRRCGEWREDHEFVIEGAPARPKAETLRANASERAPRVSEASSALLVPQRLHGLDARGAERWQEAGTHGNGAEQNA
jgi:hypothetical protein